MDDETYDKRTNTLRHYIREQRKKNPNFKLKFGPQTTPDGGPRWIHGIAM